MPRSRISLTEYFSFTRKERTGIICIAVLILLFILIPFLFPLFIKREVVDHAAFKAEIEQLNIRIDSSKDFTRPDHSNDEADHYASADDHAYRKSVRGELFYFDPNTLSVAGWIKLGVRERTAMSIQKYVSKGGKFYKPEDIGKIWGLHEDMVTKLLPYVRIELKQPEDRTKTVYEKFETAKKEIKTIDINTADTSAFIALPGIGSKLASRIIAFREKLGGFYKTEQLAETFGLPDSTFQKIKGRLVLEPGQVKKLDINTATQDELKSHPYLRYAIANAIVQYRSQHGNFVAVTDIKKIMLVTEEVFSKVSPYLTTK